MTRRPVLAEQLDLEPHPEGGWYRQTWRAPVEFRPDGYPGTRAAATAIYFLLEPGEVSAWHVVRSDELWLWQTGGPLILGIAPEPGGPGGTELVLGPDLAAGQQLQGLVPAAQWQTASPAGNEPVLVSCIVAPGFEYEDWQLA